MFHGGSRLGRAFKALVMGTIAAVAGSVLFYAVTKITGGRGAGLVAICTGLIVGGAVKAGSGNRGGWFYQLVAMFLTYSAIVAMFLPIALQQIEQKDGKDQVKFQDILNKARGKAKAEKKKNSDRAEGVAPKSKDAGEVAEKIHQAKTKEANKAPAPSAAQKASAAADPKAGSPLNPATKPVAAKNAPAPAGKAEDLKHDSDDEDPDIVNVKLNSGLSPAFLTFMIVVGILAACSLPILRAFGSPILGLMIAFALWEAWKMNRKVRLVINGPFHLAADQPLDLAAEDLDDEQ
jgi:hypothetical protein